MARRMTRGDTFPVDVETLTRPDAATVDALARLTLLAGRAGCGVRFVHASPELRELVALAGLAGVVRCEPGSGIKPRR